jgi:hypothetical protein
LTARQQAALINLKGILKDFIDWKAALLEANCGSDSELESDGESDGESDVEIKFIGRIEQEILEFCIALLNHPLKENEYQSALISGLAVLGIRDDDGWLDAEDYTPKYSAIIKLARLMVVQKGYFQRQDEIKQREEQGMDTNKAGAATKSYYELIKKLTYEFMTMAHEKRPNPTPMQWIFRARSYRFKIRYTTTADGRIQWIGDTVLYKQLRFNMTQVRSIIN